MFSTSSVFDKVFVVARAIRCKPNRTETHECVHSRCNQRATSEHNKQTDSNLTTTQLGHGLLLCPTIHRTLPKGQPQLADPRKQHFPQLGHALLGKVLVFFMDLFRDVWQKTVLELLTCGLANEPLEENVVLTSFARSSCPAQLPALRNGCERGEGRRPPLEVVLRSCNTSGRAGLATSNPSPDIPWAPRLDRGYLDGSTKPKTRRFSESQRWGWLLCGCPS